MKFLLLVLIMIVVTPLPASAQEELTGSVLQLPEPVVDLFNTFQDIKIDTSRVPLVNEAFQGLKEAAQNPEQTGSDVSGFLSQISTWFESNVGVSLSEIARVVGNFVVWVLELIVKLIKAGLSLISS